MRYTVDFIIYIIYVVMLQYQKFYKRILIVTLLTSKLPFICVHYLLLLNITILLYSLLFLFGVNYYITLSTNRKGFYNLYVCKRTIQFLKLL